MNPSHHDLHSPVRDIIKKLTVVRNQHQRTAIFLKISFKPLNGFYVKVVCRLVKKKDIRFRKQDLRQFYTHVPALAECFGRTGKLLILESKSDQGLFGKYLRIVRTGI